MKKFFLFCALAALGLFCAVASAAQTPQTSTTQGDSPRPARARVVGEVTAVDAAAGPRTVRKGPGGAGTPPPDHQTTYLPLPPRRTTPWKATPRPVAGGGRRHPPPPARRLASSP